MENKPADFKNQPSATGKVTKELLESIRSEGVR